MVKSSKAKARKISFIYKINGKRDLSDSAKAINLRNKIKIEKKKEKGKEKKLPPLPSHTFALAYA